MCRRRARRMGPPCSGPPGPPCTPVCRPRPCSGPSGRPCTPVSRPRPCTGPRCTPEWSLRRRPCTGTAVGSPRTGWPGRPAASGRGSRRRRPQSGRHRRRPPPPPPPPRRCSTGQTPPGCNLRTNTRPASRRLPHV